MAVIAANKFIQVSGAPSGGEQAMASGSWGESATGILTNGALAFPKVAGTLDDLLSVDNSGNVIYVTRGGIDTTAFHNNVAAEISAITSKATPIGADYLLIEDSADSDNKKRILISALPSGGGGTPGGSDTQVQYNDGGAFGGMSALTYDDSTGKITANAGASATGDFEVLAETTGTVVYADVSAKQMVIGSNTSFVNADLMLDNGGYLGLKETTTPTATASYAKVYTKNDNKLYFQDGAGTESALAPFVGVGGNGDVTFINNGKLGSSNALNFSSGKLTVNSTNASNGDFQVKGDLVDSLIHTDADNNRIGFGKFPTTFQYEFTSSTGITLFERETTSTNGNYQPFILRHRTTGNMTTGFGSGIIFAVEDATSGSTAIGQFQVNRGSSDANGEIKILAGVGGGETLVGISELGVMSVEKGVLSLKETTTPTAATDYGRIYTKSDNKLYFQDGAGTEHEIAFV